MEDYGFEMPTPCEHCGEIFDLNDGCASEKWYPNIVICENCHEKEEEEIEEDEIYEDENINLSNALFTFKHRKAHGRISADNLKLMKELIKELEDEE